MGDGHKIVEMGKAVIAWLISMLSYSKYIYRMICYRTRKALQLNWFACVSHPTTHPCVRWTLGPYVLAPQ